MSSLKPRRASQTATSVEPPAQREARKRFQFQQFRERGMTAEERGELTRALVQGAHVDATLTSGAVLSGMLSSGFTDTSSPPPLTIVISTGVASRVPLRELVEVTVRPGTPGDPGAYLSTTSFDTFLEYVEQNQGAINNVAITATNSRVRQAFAGELLTVDPNSRALRVRDEHGAVQRVDWDTLESTHMRVEVGRGVLGDVLGLTPTTGLSGMVQNAVRDEQVNALVTRLIQDQTVFGSDALYEFFASRPEEVPVFAQRWYGELGDPSVRALMRLAESLPSQHRALALHPLVAKSPDEFGAFYASNATRLATLTATGVWRAFITDESGPRRTLWRGLMLLGSRAEVEAQAAAIQHEHGLVPPAFLWKDHTPRMLQDWLHLDGVSMGRRGGSRGPYDGMVAHISGDTRQSGLLSVTTEPKVAEMAAFDEIFKRFNVGTFVLFKLNLSERQLAQLDGVYERVPASIPAHHVYRHGGFAMGVRSPGFEVLIERVAPANIESYAIYDSLPAGWSIAD